MVSSTPLLFVAVGLVLGICLQRYLEIGVWVWLAILLIFFIAGLVISFCRLKARVTILAYIAMLCAVCLGAVRLAVYNHIPAKDIRNFVGRERVLVTIRGSIVTDPYTRYKDDWAFAKFSHSDPSSSFYLKLKEAETVDGWKEVCGKIRVVADEPILDLKEGDYIEAYCWLSRFRGATNPGQFDLAGYMAGGNVYVGASVKSRQGFKLLSEKRSGSWAGVKERFREIVSGALLDDETIDERERGLLEALLLGYRGNIDADTYRAFEKTGLLHFISLSGMHLGIFVAMVWWVAARMRLLKPARAAVCIVLLVLFLMVVPPRAPTIRAAVIAFVFLFSIFFRRHPNPLNSLSIAAIILLLAMPTGLFDTGWQLSFATVLGILMFCKRFYYYIYERLFPESLLEGNKRAKLIQKATSPVLSLFTTSVTAWIGGAGILLYHFYVINPLSSVWTVAAFPLVAAILCLGFLKVMMSFPFPSVSALLGLVLDFLATVLITLVKFFARIDFSEILVGQVPIVVVLLYYGGIAVIVWAWYLRPLARKVVVIGMVALVAGTVGFIKWQRMHPGDLQMTCLDVGHGQAIVMQSSTGTLLFDAGSQHNRNIGQRVITPFLRYCGIGRLDAVVISHDDIDHINGLIEVVKNCDVGNVYTSAAVVEKSKESSTAKYLAECLGSEGIKLNRLSGTMELGPQMRLDILWPDGAACEDESLSDNDKSVVSLIEFAGRRILLCADIEDFAQRQLLERCKELHADVVVVPHHGSVWTSGSEFLKSLNAKYLVCSCGMSYFKRVQRSAPDVNGVWLYTARDGAVCFRIGRDGQTSIRSY
jgi:competence protein ComEC